MIDKIKKLNHFFVITGCIRSHVDYKFKYLCRDMTFAHDIKYAKKYEFEDLAIKDIQNINTDGDDWSGYYEIKKIYRTKTI